MSETPDLNLAPLIRPDPTAPYDVGWNAAIEAIGSLAAARPSPAEPPAGDLRGAGMRALRGWHMAAFDERTGHDHPVEECPDKRFADTLAALRDPATLAAEDREPLDGRTHHRCADCGVVGQYGPNDGEKAALDQLRGLRITGDQIDAAINELGPTGDRAEAYVKVAAGAAAAALRSLATLRSTTPPEPEDGGT